MHEELQILRPKATGAGAFESQLCWKEFRAGSEKCERHILLNSDRAVRISLDSTQYTLNP